MHEIFERNAAKRAEHGRRVPEAVDFGSSRSLANFHDDTIRVCVQTCVQKRCAS
jgi:hypothetical protein